MHIFSFLLITNELRQHKKSSGRKSFADAEAFCGFGESDDSASF